jgi:hypothetical protein
LALGRERRLRDDDERRLLEPDRLELARLELARLALARLALAPEPF